MLDKSVAHHVFWFRRRAGLPVTDDPIPDGYSLRAYWEGDAESWCDIETSVLEFTSPAEARVRFEKDFAGYPGELERRMFFVEDAHGRAVGNCAAWWMRKNGVIRPIIHYFAVRPEHQGRGLGKLLLSRTLRAFEEVSEERDVFLGTQTWSWRAICVYLRFGFYLSGERDWRPGAEILRQKLPDDLYQQLLATAEDVCEVPSGTEEYGIPPN